MFDSFKSRVAVARQSNQLFFAALIPAERISSMFGEASAILDSARVYTTAVTVWTFLTQVLGLIDGRPEYRYSVAARQPDPFLIKWLRQRDEHKHGD